MPRTVSSVFRAGVEAAESSNVPLIFLTITHEELSEPVRLVGDVIDYVRDGEAWTGCPFECELLTDTEEPPRARLTVQNVDRSLGQIIRNLRSPPRLHIELLSSADFDLSVRPRTEIGTADVEYSAPELFLVNIDVDAIAITAEIVSWDYTQELWPGLRATPDLTPALFR